MGPTALAHVLRPLTDEAVEHNHPDLLVGLASIDDAAVYRLNSEQAVVSTADFFPPVVDDPYSFGAIAAANAMSDVYAMGGEVLFALNLVAFPDDLDPAILTEILRGGRDKVAEAGGVIAGGHTVTDKEPKYGLSVTGVVHPEHILTKGNAKIGDVLILTKPLGTGVITTAHKREKVDAADLQAAIASMSRLNREASRLLRVPEAHAVTDVTGFGLLGHAWEMSLQSEGGLRFAWESLPWLAGARRYAEMGCVPGGTGRNQEFLDEQVRLAAGLGELERSLLFDPQTSGGLLAAIAPDAWPALRQRFADAGVSCWQIGEVTAEAGIEVV
jgi:selenide,water dikinase